jgi:hypothetical protein
MAESSKGLVRKLVLIIAAKLVLLAGILIILVQVV